MAASLKKLTDKIMSSNMSSNISCNSPCNMLTLSTRPIPNKNPPTCTAMRAPAIRSTVKKDVKKRCDMPKPPKEEVKGKECKAKQKECKSDKSNESNESDESEEDKEERSGSYHSTSQKSDQCSLEHSHASTGCSSCSCSDDEEYREKNKGPRSLHTLDYQKRPFKDCCGHELVETGTQLYTKHPCGIREMANSMRMPIAGRMKEVRFLIDSRKRDLIAYPSANDFEMLMVNRLKLVYRVELLSAIVPLLSGETERYLVLAEGHCISSYDLPNKIIGETVPPFAGSGLVKGVLAIIPLKKQYQTGGTTNYIIWDKESKQSGWSCATDQQCESAFDRLHFSLYMWDSNMDLIPYPLPDETTTPSVNNNVVYTIKFLYEE